MKEIIEFLQQLAANNNREWFNAHKDVYIECKNKFDAFTEEFIQGIRSFDDTIDQLSPKDCTYRIYRDTRFSSDKTPYKTHFGAFAVPGGKKSGFSGYYLQVGAYDKGFPGGCMLATGDYIADSKVLKILREDILLDEGVAFQKALDEAKDFQLDYSYSLKRIPNGFPADKPYSEYFKLKNYCLVKEPGHKYFLQKDLLKRVINDFKTTKPFLDILNNAIAYTREEI